MAIHYISKGWEDQLSSSYSNSNNSCGIHCIFDRWCKYVDGLVVLSIYFRWHWQSRCHSWVPCDLYMWHSLLSYLAIMTDGKIINWIRSAILLIPVIPVLLLLSLFAQCHLILEGFFLRSNIHRKDCDNGGFFQSFYHINEWAYGKIPGDSLRLALLR